MLPCMCITLSLQYPVIALHRPDCSCDFFHEMPANANDRHSEVLKELKQMRDRLKALHNKTVEKLTKENVDELLEIKDRIITLQVPEL